LYGTMSEQVLEEPSPFLADFGLEVQDTEPFFVGVRKFTTFTFFSQPRENSPTYRYHPFSLSCHLNLVNLLCFLAYATIDLVGSNNHEFTEIVACRPLGGIRENPWPPNNS